MRRMNASGSCYAIDEKKVLQWQRVTCSGCWKEVFDYSDQKLFHWPHDAITLGSAFHIDIASLVIAFILTIDRNQASLIVIVTHQCRSSG